MLQVNKHGYISKEHFLIAEEKQAILWELKDFMLTTNYSFKDQRDLVLTVPQFQGLENTHLVLGYSCPG